MTTTTPTKSEPTSTPPLGEREANRTNTPNNESNGDPTLNIIIPEEEIKEEVELDYEKAFTKLPAHMKKAAGLFGYRPKAESQEQLEEFVTKLKADYESELNASVVPLIVAKIKGEKKIEKPGFSPESQDKPKARITTPYKGY